VQQEMGRPIWNSRIPFCLYKTAWLDTPLPTYIAISLSIKVYSSSLQSEIARPVYIGNLPISDLASEALAFEEKSGVKRLRSG